MSEQRFQLLLKDDERKDMKAAMFQYGKVMGLIVLNREQESTTSDPAYIEMLKDDFNTLKKRKKELGSKLGLCLLNYVSYFFLQLDFYSCTIVCFRSTCTGN